MEFHVSKKARTAYRLEDTLFSLSGNVISLNIAEARRLVQQMNDVRQIDRYPERTVRTGQVLAMGLIDEILHYVVRLYRQQVQGTVMTDALAWLRERFGDEALDRTFSLFVSEFPGSDLWQGKTEIAGGEGRGNRPTRARYDLFAEKNDLIQGIARFVHPVLGWPA